MAFGNSKGGAKLAWFHRFVATSPSSLAKIADWADIYKDMEHKDESRNHILIYKSVPNRFGNWNK
jgi:hypothetical protein